MAKVCPQCNSVQPDELEFCPLDGGHLQPAPAGARVSGQHVAHAPGPDLRPVGPDEASDHPDKQGEITHGTEPVLPSAPPPPEAPGSRLRRPPPGRAVPPSAAHPSPAAPPPASPAPGPAQRGPSAAATAGTHRPTLLAAGVIPQLPETGGAAAPPSSSIRQTSPQRRVTGPVMVGRSNSELTPVPVVLPPPPGAGSTLADVLRRGPMAVDQAVARIGLIAEAVAAQRLGHHGQLTPWHVQFDSADGSGRPRIGASELPLDPLYASLYRAPELELADDPAAASPSVEVYALGCILFEAIAGRAPFQAPSLAELVRKHATAAAPAVRMVRRECELPPSLELEIQRALKKRPGDRHASATAFAMAIRASNREDDRSTIALNASHTQALQEMLGGRPEPPVAQTAAPTVGGAAAEQGKRGEAPAAASAPPPARPSRASNAILVMALIAILALGAGLLYYMQGGSQEPAAPPPPPPAPLIADVAAPPPLDAVDAEDVDAADSEDADAEVEVAEDVEAPEVSEPSKARPKPRPKATQETPKTEPKRDGPAVF